MEEWPQRNDRQQTVFLNEGSLGSEGLAGLWKSRPRTHTHLGTLLTSKGGDSEVSGVARLYYLKFQFSTKIGNTKKQEGMAWTPEKKAVYQQKPSFRKPDVRLLDKYFQSAVRNKYVKKFQIEEKNNLHNGKTIRWISDFSFTILILESGLIIHY